MKFPAPLPIHLKDYSPSPYLIEKIFLNIYLDPKDTRVFSRLQIRKNSLAKKVRNPLRLNGGKLKLKSIKLNGRTLPSSQYFSTEDILEISKVPDDPFILETEVSIIPKNNLALQGLYLSRGIFCTQCEAEGFRRITYFIDRPDILSEYTCRIEANKKLAPLLLSNGNLLKKGMLKSGKRHFAVWHDPFPKPCYLFALVAGDLGSRHSTFKTKSGKTVKLGLYVEHGKERFTSWAMDSLKRSMRWDEVTFNREYDLDVFNVVAVSDFNMGAMENKGLNIFNDRLILASPETATDATYEAIESVIAHEYFHNWTGNRITCRDWFQLCLKEGLTVFRDQEFSADQRDPIVQRIADVRQLRALQFAEDAGPLAHPVRPETYIEINNFYTSTVYEKGAECVRMLATLLGKNLFKKGMELFFSLFDGQAVTVEDFLACFEKVSGRDLTQFTLWYTQAGTPQVVISTHWHPSTQRFDLTVYQVQPSTPGQSKKKPLHIPLRLALLGSEGQSFDLELDDGRRLQDGVLELRKRRETFSFVHVASPPTASLFRRFSAPVHLTYKRSDRELEFLMLHDDDLFNRWQATYSFALRLLLNSIGVAQENKGAKPLPIDPFVKALGHLVLREDLPPAYRAEILKLPTPSDVAREIAQNVNHDHIFAAHKNLSRSIATILGQELEALYASLKPKAKFSADITSTGQRSLRNATLTLLSTRENPADFERVLDHFKTNRSMTDEAHALFLIAASNIPERASCLSDFFKRWKHDHLVVDTWFSAQAQSPLPETLAHVRKLTKHPKFQYGTPNKVRALIGSFAQLNPLQFNRNDGAGYNFVAEQVLKIDKINPQIAARLLGAFKSWSVLEKKRKALAKNALTSVGRHKGISKDLYEIVSKMLDYEK